MRGTKGGVEQGREAQSFFQPDDPVLHLERIKPDLEDDCHGRDHDDHQPCRMQPWPSDQMDDGRDQRDDKYRQDEKVEGRIKTRVIGKVLWRCVGHGEMLLLKVETSSHVWTAAEKSFPIPLQVHRVKRRRSCLGRSCLGLSDPKPMR
jgi:hypothetical protein